MKHPRCAIYLRVLVGLILQSNCLGEAQEVLTLRGDKPPPIPFYASVTESVLHAFHGVVDKSSAQNEALLLRLLVKAVATLCPDRPQLTWVCVQVDSCT